MIDPVRPESGLDYARRKKVFLIHTLRQTLFGRFLVEFNDASEALDLRPLLNILTKELVCGLFVLVG